MTIAKPEYFIIGHITDDIITVAGEKRDPEYYPGGSVSYGAKTAQESGYEAHIITKCNPGHPYIQKLEKMDIIVHCLPIKDSLQNGQITSFVNVYDKNGNRTQTVNHIQEEITVEDLESIREIISPNSIIQIAPVISEVDPDLILPLSKRGYLLVTPQGYFRKRKTGTVTRKEWDNIDCLIAAQIVISSTEDLTFTNGYHGSLAQQMCDKSAIFILTKQKEGSTIFQNGNQTQIHAFRLNPEEERGFTGAGDTYGAAFFIHYFRNRDLHAAGVFASFIAAMKIAGIEGNTKGIETVPTLEAIRRFIDGHQERVQEFLRENSLNSFK